MQSQPNLDILIHCPGSHGVVADQTHKQAIALHDLGIKVLLLCGPGFLRSRNAPYPVDVCMKEGASSGGAGLASRNWGKAIQTVQNQLRLAWEIYRLKPAIVLNASHVEAHSPLWILPHILLRNSQSTVYATNLHFSNPNKRTSPPWWLRLGNKLSFKPISIFIAHKRLANPKIIPKHVRMVEVPIGPDTMTQVFEDPKTIRKKWNVPRGKKVFLSFGAVRNHKNLDLAIRALLENPNAFLVMLGGVSNHKDRPIKYYQTLANDLGLEDRVYISDEFISDEKRNSYYQSADFILLTYTASYHSQTASLIHAAQSRRRVLASSGDSPMQDMVEHFGLGVYLEPDSSEAIANGMATLLHSDLPEPNWEGFEEHATWETNVLRLLESVSDCLNKRDTPQSQLASREEEPAPIPELLNARLLLKPKKTRPKAKPAAPKIHTPEEPPIAKEAPAKKKTQQKASKPAKEPIAPLKKEKPKAAKAPAGRSKKIPSAKEVPPAKPAPASKPIVVETPEEVKKRRALRRKRRQKLSLKP